MPNYKLLIRDNSQKQIANNLYSAEQLADNIPDAIQEITEYYASELDTNTDQIEVLSIVKL